MPRYSSRQYEQRLEFCGLALQHLSRHPFVGLRAPFVAVDRSRARSNVLARMSVAHRAEVTWISDGYC